MQLGVIECPARISELSGIRAHTIFSERKTVLNRYGESVRIAEWFMHVAILEKETPSREGESREFHYVD